MKALKDLFKFHGPLDEILAKIGIIIETICAITIFILAPYITAIFTTTSDALQLRIYLEEFLKITCLFYPGAAIGIASSAMFQGTGKGIYALLTTLLRTIILTVFLSIIFTIIFNWGLSGIWWAIVIANVLGSIVSFIWGKLYVNKLIS